MDVLHALIRQIEPLDSVCMDRVQRRLDNLTKPVGSLSALEMIVKIFAGAQRTVQLRLPLKAVVLMAADHGVAAESVSAYPQQVTEQMIYNFVGGGAGINVLARHANAELVLVDVGVAADLAPELPIRHYKIRKGTCNMRYQPAMSREEALEAIKAGIRIAEELANKGIQVVGLGEMGIGNTTASSAITSVLLNKEPASVTGTGAGIDPNTLFHKVNVITDAIAVNRPNAHDPIDVLAKVGGLEIAALAGLVLACAAKRMLVVIDGFISAAAVLAAYRLAPGIQPYLIASHLSTEPGHEAILEAIDVKPRLCLDMRLGEGTGAALGMTLIDAAIKILNEMATFEEARVTNIER